MLVRETPAHHKQPGAESNGASTHPGWPKVSCWSTAHRACRAPACRHPSGAPGPGPVPGPVPGTEQAGAGAGVGAGLARSAEPVG